MEQNLMDQLEVFLRKIVREEVRNVILELNRIPEQNKIDGNNFINRQEAAKILKVTIQTIDNWRKIGNMPWKRIGGKIYVDIKNIAFK